MLAKFGALVVLSELHGLNQSQTVYFTVPTLEPLNKEITRHQGR